MYVIIRGWVKPVQLAWLYEDWLGLLTPVLGSKPPVHSVVMYGSPARWEISTPSDTLSCGLAQNSSTLEKCWRNASRYNKHSLILRPPHLQFEPQEVGPVYTCTADFSRAERLCICTVAEHVPATHDFPTLNRISLCCKYCSVDGVLLYMSAFQLESIRSHNNKFYMKIVIYTYLDIDELYWNEIWINSSLFY